MPAIDKITPEEGWLLRRERAVAWLRVVFAAVAVVVIQLNPERVARFPELSFISLSSFFVYSLAVLYLAWHNKLTSSPLGILTNSLDVVWIAVIVFFHWRLTHAVLLLLFVPGYHREHPLGAQGQHPRRSDRRNALCRGTLKPGGGVHGFSGWH